MNAIFTGRKRTGKTTLAFNMAMEAGGGIIVFDPKGEFRGWPTISNVADLEESLKKNEVVVFKPDAVDVNEAFTPLGEKIFELHRVALEKGWDKIGWHFTLLIDEAAQLQTPNQINPELKRLLAQCRPEILNIFQTVHSPTDVFRTSKVCNSDWFFFHTTHIADLERIAQIAGDEVALEVSRLGYHQYVHFSEDDQSVQVVKENDDWFRPLTYSEMNREERSELVSKERSDREKRMDLLDEFMDFLELKHRRSSRDDDDDDDDRRPRRRERERDDDERRPRKKEFSLW